MSFFMSDFEFLVGTGWIAEILLPSVPPCRGEEFFVSPLARGIKGGRIFVTPDKLNKQPQGGELS